MRHFKKSILVVFSVLFALLLVANILYRVEIVRLNAEKNLWEKNRIQIINQLNLIQMRLKNFNDAVKQTGIQPLYEKIIESEKGEEAKSISETQMDFDMSDLETLNDKGFLGSVYSILTAFNLRLSSQYKDFAIFRKTSAEQHSAVMQCFPSIWPTEGTISSLFGWRIDPFTKKKDFHAGVDIANLKSTDIIATADGVVEFSGKKGGYGNAVVLDHGNGFETIYGHADSILVEEGDAVTKGTLIARMGTTGRSTGDHLHYEIHFAGELLNPKLFVQ